MNQSPLHGAFEHQHALALYFEVNPHMVPDIGCEISEGWHPAVLRALQQLQALSEATGVRIEPRQIKEKFGGLRMYVRVGVNNDDGDEGDHEDPVGLAAVRARAREIVEAAEAATALVCESCGAPAPEMSNLGGYICRRCPACIEEIDRRAKPGGLGT